MQTDLRWIQRKHHFATSSVAHHCQKRLLHAAVSGERGWSCLSFRILVTGSRGPTLAPLIIGKPLGFPIPHSLNSGVMSEKWGMSVCMIVFVFNYFTYWCLLYNIWEFVWVILGVSIEIYIRHLSRPLTHHSACTERKMMVATISFCGFLSGCHWSCALRSRAFHVSRVVGYDWMGPGWDALSRWSRLSNVPTRGKKQQLRIPCLPARYIHLYSQKLYRSHTTTKLTKQMACQPFTKWDAHPQSTSPAEVPTSPCTLGMKNLYVRPGGIGPLCKSERVDFL